MKTPTEYTIVAVPFHTDAATHDELARKVNEKLSSGFELYGSPFFSEEMMYQAMIKLFSQTSPLPTSRKEMRQSLLLSRTRGHPVQQRQGSIPSLETNFVPAKA
jgi:hypothetical protein